MSMYKVLIPSAGLGTRLGEFSKNLNKALVSIDNKPVISHVIEKFPKHIEIVIALGHKADVLKDYLEMAHSDRKLTFVPIQNYCGAGSGLGLTILECKKHLQCPFVFCPNDTVILEEIPEPSDNWVGFAETKQEDKYRTLKLDPSSGVREISEKGAELSEVVNSYIGLAGVKDYKQFWNSMEEGRKYGSIKIGESYGLNEMITRDLPVASRKFTWFDTGNLESLQYAKKQLASPNAPEILEKQDEAIWFVNGRVIKYNKDPNFILNRVARTTDLKGFVPEITANTDNMYSYRMLTGQVMSKCTNQKVFKSLLNYLESFWVPSQPPALDLAQFHKTCREFYEAKTRKRVALYFDRFSEQDGVEEINGVTIAPLENLLSKVDWDTLQEGVPVRFHGDLHFENILVSETGDFYLLDWRQDFGKNMQCGDLYYDLAKLLHGLIMSHELVNKEMYSVDHVDNIVTFDFHRKNCLVQNEKDFFKFVELSGYNPRKVRLLTALIFLNIAPLHHYPYSKLLFYLGKSMLHEEINNND